jgi:hypothetical protein
VSRLAAIAVACAACQGSGSDPGAGRGSALRDATVVALDAAPAPPEADARTKPEEPEPPDPGRVIAELAAIPAWQAVIDRAQLLGRRGQHGVVYGRVGAAILVLGAAPVASDAGVPIDAGLVASPYVWLIDDTEGNGSLAIRIALGDRANPASKDSVKPGDRIAAGGAWQLDDERRWFWKADTVQPVPPPPPSDLKDPQPAAPGHVIANGELPSGARTIGVARDGDAVYFQIVGPVPVTEGDGWQVADQLGSPAVVVLNLPGERASYGGQEMRAADERWQLKRGQTYWVRLGKLRKRGADKPPLVNARTAPVRVL